MSIDGNDIVPLTWLVSIRWHIHRGYDTLLDDRWAHACTCGVKRTLEFVGQGWTRVYRGHTAKRGSHWHKRGSHWHKRVHTDTKWGHTHTDKKGGHTDTKGGYSDTKRITLTQKGLHWQKRRPHWHKKGSHPKKTYGKFSCTAIKKWHFQIRFAFYASAEIFLAYAYTYFFGCSKRQVRGTDFEQCFGPLLPLAPWIRWPW